MKKTYSVTHKLGRASVCTPDADAIADKINRSALASGDSIDRERVQALLDNLTDADTQQTLRLSVEADDMSLSD